MASVLPISLGQSTTSTRTTQTYVNVTAFPSTPKKTLIQRLR